jgi:hypothetical protein
MATEILLFDFELFIGVLYDLFSKAHELSDPLSPNKLRCSPNMLWSTEKKKNATDCYQQWHFLMQT